jgi:hypothetical protein
MVLNFLVLLYITSWKTLNLPYQSLQVLRWWGLSSEDVPIEAFREKESVMWRTCCQLQSVASKEMRFACLCFLTAKCRLFSEAIETNANKAERTSRAEPCSCKPTVLLGEIHLCPTVCVIHKNCLLLLISYLGILLSSERSTLSEDGHSDVSSSWR